MLQPPAYSRLLKCGMRQFQYGAPTVPEWPVILTFIWCILLGLFYLRKIFYIKVKDVIVILKIIDVALSNLVIRDLWTPALLHYSYHSILSNRNIIIQEHFQHSSLFPYDIFRVIQGKEALASVPIFRTFWYTPFSSVYCSQK